MKTNVNRRFKHSSLIVLTFIICCATVEISYAQWRLKGPFNRFSIEVGTGLDIPFAVKGQDGYVNYITAPNQQIGFRYMFSDWGGLKPFYTHHRFQRGDNYLRLHQFGLEGIYNFADWLPAGNFRQPRRFNILLHAGAGIAREFANNEKENKKGRGHMVFGKGGLTPQYRVHRNIAVFADVTLHVGAKQSYAFDGSSISSEGNGYMPNASFITTNIGLHIYLGKHPHHMDWK